VYIRRVNDIHQEEMPLVHLYLLYQFSQIVARAARRFLTLRAALNVTTPRHARLRQLKPRCANATMTHRLLAMGLVRKIGRPAGENYI